MTIDELEQILAADYPDMSTKEISELIDKINDMKEKENGKSNTDK